MKQLIDNRNIPDFLLKSTYGCSLVASLLLTPFVLNNFIQGRYYVAVLSLTVVVFCIINIYSCYRNRYHEELNLYLLTPALSIAIIVAVYKLGIAGSYWAFLGVLSYYFILPEKKAWIANVVFIAIITPVSWSVLEPAVLIRFITALVGVGIFAFLSMREVSKQHYMLIDYASSDSLTGVYNRSLLQMHLEQAIFQSNRTNTPMTIFMIDIDHFKKVNDEYGHAVGDAVLESLGQFLKTYFRESDMVFRVGGEEFLILIHNTDVSKGCDVAEKMRGKIERLSLIPDQTVTVSVGVSGLQSEMDWKEWMKYGDDNLYRAKANGRNQVAA